jgi:hypothetical protein
VDKVEPLLPSSAVGTAIFSGAALCPPPPPSGFSYRGPSPFASLCGVRCVRCVRRWTHLGLSEDGDSSSEGSTRGVQSSWDKPKQWKGRRCPVWLNLVSIAAGIGGLIIALLVLFLYWRPDGWRDDGNDSLKLTLIATVGAGTHTHHRYAHTHTHHRTRTTAHAHAPHKCEQERYWRCRAR